MTAAIPGSVISNDVFVVSNDTPCRKCQYNLRGLSSESRCPECGSAVGLSLRGDMIRYSDPQWVDTLRRGISLILWSIVVFIAAAVFGAIGVAVHNRAPGIVINLVGYVMNFAGAWFLTMPDPSGLGEDRYGSSRKLIRVTLLLGIVQQLITLSEQTGTVPPAVHLMIVSVSGILALAGLVGTFATLRYLGKLAMRIPDEFLARRAELLMWGIGIPLGIVIVLGIIVAIAASSGAAASGLMFFGCFAWLCGIALIVFGLMYLSFLGKLGTQLQIQSALARQSWASAIPQAELGVNI